MYDPNSGRFVSRDPIGFASGEVNLYLYCGNNPVNATDPSGLQQQGSQQQQQQQREKDIQGAIAQQARRVQRLALQAQLRDAQDVLTRDQNQFNLSSIRIQAKLKTVQGLDAQIAQRSQQISELEKRGDQLKRQLGIAAVPALEAIAREIAALEDSIVATRRGRGRLLEDARFEQQLQSLYGQFIALDIGRIHDIEGKPRPLLRE